MRIWINTVNDGWERLDGPRIECLRGGVWSMKVAVLVRGTRGKTYCRQAWQAGTRGTALYERYCKYPLPDCSYCGCL